MKKLSPLIAVLFILSNIFSANAEALTPKPYSIGEKPIYSPIEEFSFSFDDSVAVDENANATIYIDNIAVATANPSVLNKSRNNRTVGYAIFTFDPPVSLPKGKTYQFIVPEGIVWLKNKPDYKNELISIDITIPEYLELHSTTVKPDQEFSTETYNLHLIYQTEVKALGDTELLLYRKGLLVRRFPTYVSWDWEVGNVSTGILDYALHFAKGVEYCLAFEAGSISALKRDDIVNKEERVDFIGGYEGLPALTYSSYALDDAAVAGLGRVMFTYDRPIMIDPEAKIQLFQDSDNPVMEVTPTIQELNGKWRLTADFTQAMIDKERGFTVVILAEAVISADGDIIVNDRNEVAINGGSGVEEIDSDSIKVTAADDTVRIEGAPTGTPIEIYSPSGRLVTKTTDTCITLPAPGIYILKIGIHTTKIVY